MGQILPFPEKKEIETCPRNQPNHASRSHDGETRLGVRHEKDLKG